MERAVRLEKSRSAPSGGGVDAAVDAVLFAVELIVRVAAAAAAVLRGARAAMTQKRVTCLSITLAARRENSNSMNQQQ